MIWLWLIAAPLSASIQVVVARQAWEPAPFIELEEAAKASVLEAVTASEVLRLGGGDAVLRVELRLVSESESMFMIVSLAGVAANGAERLSGLSPKDILARVRKLGGELGAKVGKSMAGELGIKVSLPPGALSTASLTDLSRAVLTDGKARAAVGRCAVDDPNVQRREGCARTS